MRPPSCERDPAECRIVSHGMSRTLLGWMPTYDGNGRQIGRDPNITTEDMECRTCGRRWTERTQYGETAISVEGR